MRLFFSKAVASIQEKSTHSYGTKGLLLKCTIGVLAWIKKEEKYMQERVSLEEVAARGFRAVEGQNYELF